MELGFGVGLGVRVRVGHLLVAEEDGGLHLPLYLPYMPLHLPTSPLHLPCISHLLVAEQDGRHAQGEAPLHLGLGVRGQGWRLGVRACWGKRPSTWGGGKVRGEDERRQMGLRRSVAFDIKTIGLYKSAGTNGRTDCITISYTH